MSKKSIDLAELPHVVQSELTRLGENLVIARKRRGESRKVWAHRIGISEPTAMRMERGDAGVSMGTYALALWMIGLHTSISELANPVKDINALEKEISKLKSVRKQFSIERKLNE